MNGKQTAAPRAITTVRIMVLTPEEIPANRAHRLETKLAAKLSSTAPSTTRLSRAGGTIMARNMPYSPTLRALTSRSGRMLPTATPRKVPKPQPGIAMLIAP